MEKPHIAPSVWDAQIRAGATLVMFSPGQTQGFDLFRTSGDGQRTAASDPVFVSWARNGEHRCLTVRNVEARLITAVKEADKRLAEVEFEPIGKCSSHSFRRAYASLRAALRDDPVYIAEQLGRTDARFTFRATRRPRNVAGGCRGAPGRL